jgi:hypothetical protein
MIDIHQAGQRSSSQSENQIIIIEDRGNLLVISSQDPVGFAK